MSNPTTILPGASSWRLTLRREEAGLVLLRAVTRDVRAALPDALLGCPVAALGPYALSPEAGEAEGETVELRAGPPAGDWDNRRLRELTLPRTLSRVGDYALLNCGALEKLTLPDGVAAWGSGALMNCRSLGRFELHQSGPRPGPALAHLTGALNWELDAVLHGPAGDTRLIFPEDWEAVEENCPAHVFHYNISGGGYPYRNCFREKRLDLTAYDNLWPGFLAGDYEPDCALRLAWWRLRLPAGLGENARRGYESYLRANARRAAEWRLEEGDAPGLGWLLGLARPDRETLAVLCAQARERGRAEALALLLEEEHTRVPAGDAKRFEL